MNVPRLAGRSLTGPLAVAVLVAACSTGAGAPVPPSAGASVAPSPAPSDVAPSSPPPDAVVTSPPDGAGGGVPGGPVGSLVVPKPGQLDTHPVAIDGFAARVDGSKIVVTATWTSGVEPCSTLDRIVVDPKPAGRTYTVTLLEGHGPEEIACIMIAQVKKTEFEIPTPGAGAYTILDGQGQAPPLQVTVS